MAVALSIPRAIKKGQGSILIRPLWWIRLHCPFYLFTLLCKLPDLFLLLQTITYNAFCLFGYFWVQRLSCPFYVQFIYLHIFIELFGLCVTIRLQLSFGFASGFQCAGQELASSQQCATAETCISGEVRRRFEGLTNYYFPLASFDGNVFGTPSHQGFPHTGTLIFRCF